MVQGWIESAAGACARMTLTQRDQWYRPDNKPPQPLLGVWLQGPRGLAAFCVPEDATATLISILSPRGSMIHQARHFDDLANHP